MHRRTYRHLSLWLILLVMGTLILPPRRIEANPVSQTPAVSVVAEQSSSPPEPVLRSVYPPRISPPLPQTQPDQDVRKQQASGKPATQFTNLNAQSLVFVPNTGQTDSAVRFHTNSLGGSIFFTPGEVVFALPAPSDTGAASATRDRNSTHAGQKVAREGARAVVRLQYIHANAASSIVGADRLPGVANYLTGNDRRNWRTNLPTYAGVAYQQIYSGIDLHYTGTDGRLKSIYTVAANTDPSRIRWRYQGAADVHVNDAGHLVITLQTGQVRSTATLTEAAPVAWQEIAGKRVSVSARYTIDTDGSVGFALGSYDRAHPLTIDPSISYYTTIDGNSGEYANAIAIDAAGNAYVTGETSSTNFPGTLTGSYKGGGDVFVVKLDPNGNRSFSTYLGGTSADMGRGIALDTSGALYVVGYTYSTDFSNLGASNGGEEGFVVKLSGSGAFQAGRYLGGSATDQAFGVAVDSSNTIYITGKTNSSTLTT